MQLDGRLPYRDDLNRINADSPTGLWLVLGPQGDVSSLEASYQAQLQQLQSSLSRAGDKQAKQFEMLEREHAQVGVRVNARISWGQVGTAG